MGPLKHRRRSSHRQGLAGLLDMSAGKENTIPAQAVSRQDTPPQHVALGKARPMSHGNGVLEMGSPSRRLEESRQLRVVMADKKRQNMSLRDAIDNQSA